MTDDENTNTEPVPTDGVVTEEWVDENVIQPDETEDDDSVMDCCCDKRKTYDNNNYCIKMPRKNLTVSEAVAVTKILLELLDYMPTLLYCYDSSYAVSKRLNDYLEDCLHILYDNDCLNNNGDVTFDGDKI